ncbi:MAG: redox-regulated ATPase YchF [Planctomycetota bacterium]|nr:MAG: redox-regulated ATPase YchF [Planctomycetota bacterium]
MNLSCGIVGLPNVGKSTIYNALTAAQVESGSYPFSTTEPNLAVIEVPDKNLEILPRLIETKKVIPAAVQIVDIAGLPEGASRGEGMGNRFLAVIREVDAIMHIVQCFENPHVVRETPVDPAKDMEVLELELALADLETVTRGVERVSKKARTGDKASMFEQQVYERAKALLEEGTQLRTVPWKTEELLAIQPLCLLTMKPVLYVANVGDDDLTGEGAHGAAVAQHAESMSSEWIPLCGDLECELRRMESEDREVFMAEYGMKELGLARLIRAAYIVLGLQTFYTVGEKEIRAWTIAAGDTAPVAAGKIHTDFLKGFIRAEVYSVDDLIEYKTEAAIKAAGKMRTEGRDYVMHDRDVCHFLIGR